MLRAGGVATAWSPVPHGGVRYATGLAASYSLGRRLGSSAGWSEALAGRVVVLGDDDSVGAASNGLIFDGARFPASVEGVREVSLPESGIEAHVVVNSFLLVHVTTVVLVETLWNQK